MTTRILVSGASGIVGYGVLKSLRQGDPSLEIIGTTTYQHSVAPHFSDQVEIAPHTDHPTYISWLKDTITRLDVTLVIPGLEIDLFKWNSHREEIRAQGCAVALNQPALIDLCEDKWHFYQELKAADLSWAIPSTLDDDFERLASELGLPFLLKPRRGFGSKGVAIVNSEESFNPHRAAMGRVLMAQPIVGHKDEEYTIAIFGDGEGDYTAEITMRRTLSAQGFTEKAVVCTLPGAQSALKALCRHFKPIGPTNLQFRVEQGNLKLLEINPRISSSTSIRTACGYNESLMTVRYFLDGKLPPQPLVRPGRAVRYTEEVVTF